MFGAILPEDGENMALSPDLITELIAIFGEEFGMTITYPEAEDLGESLVVAFEALSRCKRSSL